MFLVLSLVPIIVLNFPFSCVSCVPLCLSPTVWSCSFFVYFLFYFEGPHVVFCASSSLWSFLSHQWLIEFTYPCSVISLCLFLKSLSVYHRYTLFFTESSLVMDFIVFISLNLNHAARFVYFLFYKNPMNASARTLESGYRLEQPEINPPTFHLVTPNPSDGLLLHFSLTHEEDSTIHNNIANNLHLRDRHHHTDSVSRT